MWDHNYVFAIGEKKYRKIKYTKSSTFIKQQYRGDQGGFGQCRHFFTSLPTLPSDSPCLMHKERDLLCLLLPISIFNILQTGRPQSVKNIFV